MTVGGAKSRRTSGFEDAPTPSAFAPLRPFLKSNETDLSRGFENLSAELARLDSQVRLDVEVLEGSDTHAWVLECGLGRSLVRPRPRAGKTKKPNVRVVVRHETWLQIAQGKLDVAADRPGEAQSVRSLHHRQAAGGWGHRARQARRSAPERSECAVRVTLLRGLRHG
jgi:hypothetical protein